MENPTVEIQAVNEAYEEWLEKVPGFNEIAYLQEIGYLSNFGEVSHLLLETY